MSTIKRTLLKTGITGLHPFNFYENYKNTAIQAYVEFLAIPMNTASLIDSIQRYSELLRRKENSSADLCNPF